MGIGKEIMTVKSPLSPLTLPPPVLLPPSLPFLSPPLKTSWLLIFVQISPQVMLPSTALVYSTKLTLLSVCIPRHQEEHSWVPSQGWGMLS